MTHIETTCPNCHHPLRVRTEYSGIRIICKYCKQTFIAPRPVDIEHVVTWPDAPAALEAQKRLEAELSQLRADLDARTEERDAALKSTRELKGINSQYLFQVDDLQKQLAAARDGGPEPGGGAAREVDTSWVEQAVDAIGEPADTPEPAQAEELARLAGQLQAERDEIARLRDESGRVSAELEAGRSECGHLREEIDRLQAEAGLMLQQLDLERADAAKVRDELCAASDAADRAGETARGELAGAIAERDDLARSLEESEARLAAARAEAALALEHESGRGDAMRQELESRLDQQRSALLADAESSLAQERDRAEALRQDSERAHAGAVEQLQRDLEALRAETATARREADTLRAERDSAREQIEALSAGHDELAQRHGSLEAAGQEAHERHQAELARLAGELEQARGREADALKQRDELAAALRLAEEEHWRLRNEQEGARNEHDLALAKLTDDIEAVRAEAAANHARVSDIDAARIDLERRLADAQAGLRAARDHADQAERQHQQTGDEHAAALAKLQQSLDAALHERDDLAAELREAQLTRDHPADLRDDDSDERELVLAILERDLQAARAEVDTQRRTLANAESARRDLETRLAASQAALAREPAAGAPGNGAASTNSSAAAGAELAAARSKIDDLSRRLLVNQVHYDKMRETLESLGISVS